MNESKINNITKAYKDISYGEMIPIEYDSKTVGCKRKANVILPPNYDGNQSYPLLILLHGIGGDENEWLNANPVEMIGNLIAQSEAVPMITLIPNVRARVGDENNPNDIYTLEHFQAFDHFINDLKYDLMPYLEAHYNIQCKRESRAIAGLSMGGREAFYIGFSMQETFGYIGAFSPAFGLLPYEFNNVREEGLLKEEGMVLKKHFENTYISIITGDADGVIHNEPFRYHEVLSNNQVKHHYMVVPGGHDFTVWTKGLSHFIKEIF